MATVIRMQRGGRTHAPYYRVVVMDSRKRTRGVEVDVLGVYQPMARPEPKIEIDKAKALEWLQKGAQPSDTARTVLSKNGVLQAFAEGKKPEDLAEPAAEPAAAEPAAAAPETPAESE